MAKWLKVFVFRTVARVARSAPGLSGTIVVAVVVVVPVSLFICVLWLTRFAAKLAEQEVCGVCTHTGLVHGVLVVDCVGN